MRTRRSQWKIFDESGAPWHEGRPVSDGSAYINLGSRTQSDPVQTLKLRGDTDDANLTIGLEDTVPRQAARPRAVSVSFDPATSARVRDDSSRNSRVEYYEDGVR